MNGSKTGRIQLTLVGCAVLAGAALAHGPGTPARSGGRTREAFSGALPALAGELEASVVEVSDEPGGASAPHTHEGPIIGYVLEGRVRMQLQGQPEAVHAAGQTFYEAPRGVHQVSANASDEVRALPRLLGLRDLAWEGEDPMSQPAPWEKRSSVSRVAIGGAFLSAVAGLRLGRVPFFAAGLLAPSGTAVALSAGIKSTLDSSGFSASTGALLLGLRDRAVRTTHSSQRAASVALENP
jgi:quercetin dioxygenase-like cupin family protein